MLNEEAASAVLAEVVAEVLVVLVVAVEVAEAYLDLLKALQANRLILLRRKVPDQVSVVPE